MKKDSVNNISYSKKKTSREQFSKLHTNHEVVSWSVSFWYSRSRSWSHHMNVYFIYFL